MKRLLGSRRDLFIAIANNPGICGRELLTTGVQRVPHHIIGLRKDGFIEVDKVGTKRGQRSYCLTKMGQRMFQELRNASPE